MRITDIYARTVEISRYADPDIPSAGLTTTILAAVTDVTSIGKPIVGFGFSSVGRFGQTGLILDRFAPRLLAANPHELACADGQELGEELDPLRAWDCLMKGEKAGGHGERCVAVGTLDMALWDAAAKIESVPLWRLLQSRFGRTSQRAAIPVYAGGGYYFPSREIDCLSDEVRDLLDEGYTAIKIKIGGRELREDRARIEAVLRLLPQGGSLAVDAMNRYSRVAALEASRVLLPYRLRWFEDPLDPLDFEAHKELSEAYSLPLAVGEATFSVEDARNLIRYAGLRRDWDRLTFDPVHCYGVPGFLKIIELFERHGWSRDAFHTHGGHLFSLHVVAGLGLGGTEANPRTFQPFGGFSDGAAVVGGAISLPDAPGVGFETRKGLHHLFQTLLPH
jgi:L-alanine-DL-glutamate epimerase-like enolase superfamily enzyme